MSTVSGATMPSAMLSDLDRLAGRAAQTLVHAARLRVAGDAFLSAIPVFPIAALVALVAMLFGASPLAVALLGFGIPLVAFAVLAGIGCARIRAARGEALGWVDAKLDLKGRMRTADRFLSAGPKGGFEQAAIIDAARYLERIAGASLDRDASQFVFPLRAKWIIAGSVALILAAVVLAGLWRSAPIAGGDAQSGPVAVVADALDLGRQAAAAPRAGSDGRSIDGAIGKSGATQAGATRDGAGSGNGAGGGGATGSAESRAETRGSAGGAADGGAGAANVRRSSDFRAAGAAGERSRANGDRDRGVLSGEGAQQGGRSTGDSGAARASTPIASAQVGAKPQQNAAQSSPSRTGKQDGSQSSQGQSRDGSQSQSQPGRGRSSGARNGSNDSSSEQKASFGVAGLLLGVPMADQLTGTRNPGPARRRYAEGPPAPASARNAQAEERGTGSGRTGSRPQPTRSARETRMLREWFARGDDR